MQWMRAFACFVVVVFETYLALVALPWAGEDAVITQHRIGMRAH